MDQNKFGLSLIIQRDGDETDEIYTERVWWILSQNLNDREPEDIERLIALSHIHINRKIKGCEYSDDIDEIHKLKKNIYC